MSQQPPRNYGRRKNHRGSPRHPPPRRYRFEAEDGSEIAGAGVLLYDSDGIWLVGEKSGDRTVYTDPGGKYRCGDGHIYATAAREANEELYHTIQLTGAHIAYISTIERPISVDDHKGDPVYICYPIHLSSLEKIGVTISVKDFQVAREYTLKRNSKAPPSTFPIIELKKFSYIEVTEQLQSRSPIFSSRLLEIMRKSDLKLLSDGSTEHHFKTKDESS